MPTTYTHYKFGQEVRKQAPPVAAKAIAAYPQLYDIGLHGPDILFYYSALSHNQVNYLGKRIHELPGAVFFKHAAGVIRESANQDAAYAYIYGFICHFALDVSCHGYIQERINATGISHAELEAELDRELMARDGLNPSGHKVTGHLHPSLKYAKLIQGFFPNISQAQIYRTLRDMKILLNLLVAPGAGKRKLLLGLMKLSGHYESLHGLIVHEKENPLCRESTERLLQLYEDAKKLALHLIEEYPDYVMGSGKLDRIYRYNFSSRLPERED
ncbi:MAG: zinc dependent phospholipase C family protein [Roseburia sp.]|nr:zinc dependent phospholipase C family protein [Roseburia sp.]